MGRALIVTVILAVFSGSALAQGEPEPAAEPAAEAAAEPKPPLGEGSIASLPGLRSSEAGAKPNLFPMGWRLVLSDLTIFRLNPIGLETRTRFGLQKKLYASTNKVTENNFFFVGMFPKLNPASAQFSIGGEIQPASIFNVRAFYELQQYFGTFGFLQSFTSANSNFSDTQLKELADQPATEPEAKLVKHFSVQPTLLLKFGKVVLRSLLMIDYWDFKTRGTLIYEPTFDTLLPRQGWTMATDTDLLFVPGTGLAAGLRHSYVKPFYKDDHFNDAADRDAYDGQNSHHRVGFFGAYTFRDDGPSTFNKPTVLLILSMYIQHKYRAGEPSTLDAGHSADDYRTRAFPYLVLGFAFESDFLAIRER